MVLHAPVLLCLAFATESWSCVNVGLGFSKRFFGQMVCIWFFVVSPWAILVYLKIFALGPGILQQGLGILFCVYKNRSDVTWAYLFCAVTVVFCFELPYVDPGGKFGLSWARLRRFLGNSCRSLALRSWYLGSVCESFVSSDGPWGCRIVSFDIYSVFWII